MNTSADSPDDRAEEAIRHRAYMIWLAEGQPDGRADDHWYQAVADIRQETEQMHRSRASAGAPVNNPPPSRK
jgi:DUF2934 family protein